MLGDSREVAAARPDGGQSRFQGRFINALDVQMVVGREVHGSGRRDGDAEAGVSPEDRRARIVVAADDIGRNVVRGEGIHEQLLKAPVEDQRPSRQFLHADRFPLRGPVEVLRHRGDHGLRLPVFAVEMRGIERRAHDGDLDEPLFQQLDELIRIAVVDLKLDARIRLPEGAHALLEQDAAGGRDGAEGQRPAEPLLEIPQLSLRRRGHLEELLGARGEEPAGIRQLDVMRAAAKEREPEFFLEQLHLIAQRRLGHVQPPRGSRNLPLLHDRHEITQLFQIHNGSHSSLVLSSILSWRRMPTRVR